MFKDGEYPGRKDHRKAYIRRGVHDKSCRPNGGCPYCEASRKHSTRKREKSTSEQLQEPETPETGE